MPVTREHSVNNNNDDDDDDNNNNNNNELTQELAIYAP